MHPGRQQFLHPLEEPSGLGYHGFGGSITSLLPQQDVK
jgi:hypothetical protein